jgi:DNA-binding transcriptional LysR family regulator
MCCASWKTCAAETRHVEIALIHALTRGRLPDVLAALHQRHPGITLGLRVLDSEEIRAAVAEGQVDFGLCFEPQSIRDITVHAFAEMPLGFVRCPITRSPSARPSALHPAAAGRSSCPPRRWRWHSRCACCKAPRRCRWNAWPRPTMCS